MAIPTNRIITRGMGPTRGNTPGRASMVTQGYDGAIKKIIEAVQEATRQIVLHGKSAYEKIDDRVVVYAKLVRVNGEKTYKRIEGSVTVYLSAITEGAVRLFEFVTKKAKNVVSIVVKRL